MDNREGKIDSLVDFLGENNIVIIDSSQIGAVVIDAEFVLDKEDNSYEYNELLEKEISEDDIDKFKLFVEENHLMMIRSDQITGVSFEQCEYSNTFLYESNLWEDEEKEEKSEE